MKKIPIVVLTPIKNEEWIIAPFLRACSQFADHIILLVQDTHDRSRDLAAEFPKAHIVENTSRDYSESSRIRQLLESARQIAGKHSVLVAIDADEIPLNSPMALQQWETIRQLPPGSNISFKKPDLLEGGNRIVNLPKDWILGFVDDGRDHIANEVHAQRIPAPMQDEAYHANEIPLLHLNLIRPRVNRAKRRMYCVIENAKSIRPLYRRLLIYDHTLDFSLAGEQFELPPAWHEALLNIGFDPSQIKEDWPFWQEYEVLKYFKKYGTQRFRWDDIWDTDWEQTRLACRSKGWTEVPDEPIPAQNCIQCCSRGMLQAVIRFSFPILRKLKT